MSVAWTTVRRSRARVRSSRRKPSRHDHSLMYAFGAYWSWMPPIRSSARGIGKAGALEEELSREQRAVQLTLREGSLGARRHGANLAATDPGGRWASAMPPTTRAPPTASQIVTGSSRKIAPNVTARGGIAYAYVTARVGPRPLRPGVPEDVSEESGEHARGTGVAPPRPRSRRRRYRPWSRGRTA